MSFMHRSAAYESNLLKKWRRYMKNLLAMLLFLFMLAGCATPVTVKQAIKSETEAYADLQTAVKDFTKQYISLNEELSQLHQEARVRVEEMATVRALTGTSADGLPDNTWAKANYLEISDLAGKLDTIPKNRIDILNVYEKSGGCLEKSFLHGLEQAKQDELNTQKIIKEVKNGTNNTLNEISALLLVHETIGDYLNIDLSPDSKTLKAAIDSLKALKK